MLMMLLITVLLLSVSVDVEAQRNENTLWKINLCACEKQNHFVCFSSSAD